MLKRFACVLLPLSLLTLQPWRTIAIGRAHSSCKLMQWRIAAHSLRHKHLPYHQILAAPSALHPDDFGLRARLSRLRVRQAVHIEALLTEVL